LCVLWVVQRSSEGDGDESGECNDEFHDDYLRNCLRAVFT
jgi:hypothetical protein